MIFASLLTFVTLATAIPVQQIPIPPQTTLSKTFRLVAHVTDTTRDFSPSIEGYYVSSIHVGAGLGVVTVEQGTRAARVYYINGTTDEVKDSQSTIVSDTGTPPNPWGISLHSDTDSQTASKLQQNAGKGTAGVTLSPASAPLSYLLPEQFAVCNETIPYYQGQYFLVVKQIDTSTDSTIPKNCAPVLLLPECTEMPSESGSDHGFAQISRCYQNVSGIKWPLT